MSKPGFYIYPGDFKKDTCMMTLEAVGAYTLLLFVLNETGGTVTWTTDAYARLWATTELRAEEIIAEFETYNVVNVDRYIHSLSTGEIPTNGQQTVNKGSTKPQQNLTKLTNRRMAREAEKKQHIREVRSAAGKISAKARQQKDLPSYPNPHISYTKKDHKNDLSEQGNKKNQRKDGKPFADKRQLTDHFTQAYLAKVGTKYLFQNAKDGQIADRLLKLTDLEQLKLLIDKFFASRDEWILKAGYTLAVFESQVNKLAAGRPDVPAGWESLRLWNDKTAEGG